MRPSKRSIKREYSHLTKNWEVPQDDSRLMRRLKRRSIASEMMERNYSANVKRKKVASCGHEAVKNAENNSHVLVEEVDEDYRFFLDKVDFHVDVVSANNIIASDVDVNTCHDSDKDGDTDAHYKSRMGPSKGTIKQEYSHLTANWEVFKNDSRLMRRLKRRSIASEIMERHYSSNAKRKNVGSFGDEVVKNTENSGNVLEEEVGLDKVDFHVNLISDDNIIASDIDINTSHDSDNDDDTDAQYKMLLENLREDDKSYILKVFVDNQLFCVRYEGQEVRFHDLVNSEVQCEGDDEDYQLFLNSSRLDGDSLICMPERDITITYGESESEVQCEGDDEDYQLFLNSSRLDGDSLICMPERDITITYGESESEGERTDDNNLIYMPENGLAAVYGEECDQSSTDSEPIILHPSQHYEDSPSICSESYRSFCLADERNHKDSLYRKGLMEELERPYNQKELDKLLQVASHERLKELHREMRHGVTKDRPKGGDDNKTSYLKMHSGLQNAINQVKEPNKVLFLLRGFFYWLKHVPQGGAFRPWLDASCLKMLQKL
ncbi:hypothetical protein K1719_042048 [Acacia pycnantha]|nr:hypothetical protein K1719_042048 [Acacia pycnantha]